MSNQEAVQIYRQGLYEIFIFNFFFGSLLFLKVVTLVTVVTELMHPFKRPWISPTTQS
jgi:hypothetical protein